MYAGTSPISASRSAVPWHSGAYVSADACARPAGLPCGFRGVRTGPLVRLARVRLDANVGPDGLVRIGIGRGAGGCTLDVDEEVELDTPQVWISGDGDVSRGNYDDAVRPQT